MAGGIFFATMLRHPTDFQTYDTDKHTHTHTHTLIDRQTDRHIVVHNIDWLTNASYTQTNLLKNLIYEKYFF